MWSHNIHDSFKHTFLFPKCGLCTSSSWWYGSQANNGQIPVPLGQSESKEPSHYKNTQYNSSLSPNEAWENAYQVQ